MVTRFCWWRLALAVACCASPFACLYGADSEEPQLVLETNKQTYLVGEPVLMRTTLRNDADEPYEVGPFRAMIYGGGGPYAHLGFSVEVRRGDETLGSVFEPSHEAPIGAAPRHYEGLCDRGVFPTQIDAGRTVYRIDMCSLEKPGTYQLSAYLAGEKGRRIESGTVEIEVVSLDDSDDPITTLLDPDTIAALGRSIVVAYYVDGEATDYGGAMNPDELTPITHTVLTRARKSVFYEHVRHIWLLRQRDERRSLRSQVVLSSAEAIEAAEAFLKDYPDSWLAADVMRLLFFTHLANKQPGRALQIGIMALALDPVPTVVPAMGIRERIDQLAAADANAHVDSKAALALETNKQTYLVGEPILLRTTLGNEADKPYAVGAFRGMIYGGGGPYAHLGFSVEVRRGDETLGSVFEPSHDAPLGAAPRHHKGLFDRNAFPAQIDAGRSVYRIDMCSLEEPGTYQLSAFLAGQEGRRIESGTVEIEVLPLEDSDDPITTLLDSDTIVPLGRSIVVVYYVDGEVTDYGGAMKPEELAPIIQTVLTRGRTSVFYEHAAYISFLRERDYERGGPVWYTFATREATAAAEAFVKEHKDSWLLADVMRVLFYTYTVQGQTAKAIDIGRRALALDPEPAVVRQSMMPRTMDKLNASARDKLANGGD